MTARGKMRGQFLTLVCLILLSLGVFNSSFPGKFWASFCSLRCFCSETETRFSCEVQMRGDV